MKIYPIVIKSGRMSGMLVSGKNFSITKYVMSDDIDDIPDITV